MVITACTCPEGFGLPHSHIPQCDCICHVRINGELCPHPDNRRCPHCHRLPHELEHTSEPGEIRPWVPWKDVARALSKSARPHDPLAWCEKEPGYVRHIELKPGYEEHTE